MGGEEERKRRRSQTSQGDASKEAIEQDDRFQGKWRIIKRYKKNKKKMKRMFNNNNNTSVDLFREQFAKVFSALSAYELPLLNRTVGPDLLLFHCIDLVPISTTRGRSTSWGSATY